MAKVQTRLRHYRINFVKSAPSKRDDCQMSFVSSLLSVPSGRAIGQAVSRRLAVPWLKRLVVANFQFQANPNHRIYGVRNYSAAVFLSQ